MPQATLDHYRDFRQRGERAFLFHGIAHVLFRGSIPRAEIEVMRV